jgi:hypothetical protein
MKKLSCIACRTAIGLLSIVALQGCEIIDTGSHYDETNDFGDYRSFSWIDDTPYIEGGGRSEVRVSPLTQTKIERAIKAELESRGYSFTEDRDEADFVIAYTVGTRDEITVNSYPYPYRGDWGWHVYGSRYYVHEYREHSYTRGTLSVDVFDGDTNGPVWHGWAEKTITESDREDPSQSIIDAVTRLFEEFPR